jgi:hypothetical protein
MNKPHDYTKPQLQKVGITLIRAFPLTLKCKQCGEMWQVRRRGLRLPKGYWECPNGCNLPAVRA